jgi:predicted phosphodiesterase
MILFVGDTHGDLNFAQACAEVAADYNHAPIVQVGDWGYLWPGRDKAEQLAEILRHHSVTMHFIDGNHDDHARLPMYPLPHPLVYHPRGTAADVGGHRVLFMGGAPSFDRDLRVKGRSWWPEEVITQAQVDAALEHSGINVVVTHDAPDYPPGFTPKGSEEHVIKSAQSMAFVRQVVEHHSPKVHVHGHWHVKYRRGVTVGLGCNASGLGDAVKIWGEP